VGVQQLVGAFAKRGIALYREEECAEPSEVYLASNLAAPLSAEQLEALSARQGDILCALYGSRYGTRLRRTHYEGEEETDLDVLNVKCTVYPSDGDRAEQQIQSVEAAMRDLTRKTK
jgi:hypothetical protein